jgi:uncharacterized membrane protein required for colicin V production
MDSYASAISSLAPLDMVGLGLITVLIALGLWRGLWWQVIRLIGVVFAVALARIFSSDAAVWIGESWPELSARMTQGLAWISIFLLALGAATILGLLGQRILEAMQLGLVNRIGGGLAGGITGMLLHLAALIAIVQLAPEPFVERHVAGTVSGRLVDIAGNRWRVVIGAEAAEEIEQMPGWRESHPPRDPDGPRAPRGIVR